MEESGTLQTWSRRDRLSNSKLVKMERLPGDCFFQAVWERERTCADSGLHGKCLWIDLAGMSRKVWMEAGNVSELESQLRT